MDLNEAKQLVESVDNNNWLQAFELLKNDENSKMRMLACNLLIQQKQFEMLDYFLQDKDGHVRKNASLHYYKRSCVSNITEKIIFDFIPFTADGEFAYTVGSYPYTVTIGITDFDYFFADIIKNAFPICDPFDNCMESNFDYTSLNCIPKDDWNKIMQLLHDSLKKYKMEQKLFAEEMYQWLEAKLKLSAGIYIYGNL